MNSGIQAGLIKFLILDRDKASNYLVSLCSILHRVLNIVQ